MYADMDMISYLPCDPLLDGASCVLGVENHIGKHLQTALGYRQPWQLANFIFAAVPGHPFFGELLEEVARYATRPVPGDEFVEETTGARMLTRLACALPPERRGAIKVLPQINWNAPWSYPRIGPLAPRIYARHACFGSWRTQKLWLRRTWRGVRLHYPNPFAVTGPDLP
jgi:hypothetical protein